MENNRAPRARFVAAIILFLAVVIGDLVLCRGYLAQGLPTWPACLIIELVMLVLLADFWAATQWMPVLRPVFAALALLTLMLGQYAFALLARYENTLLETLKNACLLAVGYFPRTLAMAVFAAALWLLSVQFLRYGAPILFLFGLSLPCYVTLLLLRSVFSQLDHSHSQS